MKKPLISCVVPSYNSEKYLRDALSSILGQTYRPLEIIIADDGSTDGTADVAAIYGNAIRFFSQDTSGPAATRNFGLTNASGEFVAFIDADDLWHREKLEKQMARFEQRPELDLCITYARMFWSESLIDEETSYREHPRAKQVPGYATTTLLARRKVFDTIGVFDDQYWFGDATDWFIRAKERGLIIELVPEVLTYHRMHESNLTRRRSTDSRDEFLMIVKKSLDRRRSQS